MSIFLYGVFGALGVLALLGIGVVIGWDLRARTYKPKAEKPGVDELQRMREEQEAFLELQHYNADVAYGVTKDALEGGDVS